MYPYSLCNIKPVELNICHIQSGLIKKPFSELYLCAHPQKEPGCKLSFRTTVPFKTTPKSRVLRGWDILKHGDLRGWDVLKHRNLSDAQLSCSILHTCQFIDMQKFRSWPLAPGNHVPVNLINRSSNYVNYIMRHHIFLLTVSTCPHACNTTCK